MRVTALLAFLIAASGCMPTRMPAPADGPLMRLQGAWQSTQDPTVVVRFTGDRFTETVNGEVMTDEPLRIVSGCPGDGGGAPGQTFFTAGNDFCYVVVDETATTLEYSLVGGRGNTLSFRRLAGGAGER